MNDFHPVLKDKELYEEIVNKFRSLNSQKALFKEKMTRYKSLAAKATEDKIPYRSSSDYTLDVRVTGSARRDGPQVATTIAFKGLEEELIELGAYLADLEEALMAAISSAAMKASQNQRVKIKRALMLNLIYGEKPSVVGVEWHTLEKYRDYAVVYAAENLNYVEARTKTHREKKKRIETALRAILTGNN